MSETRPSPIRRRPALLLAAAATCLAMAVTSTPAAAATPDRAPTFTTDTRTGPETTEAVPDVDLGPGRERGIYRLSLVNVTTTTNVPGPSGLPIAKCAAASDGTTCTIQAGISAAATVGVSLGVNVQAVVQGLGPTITGGFSASKTLTVSLTVGCSSPALQKGQAFGAFTVGTLVTYQIRKTDVFTGRTTTSEELEAYFPEPNGIACGII